MRVSKTFVFCVAMPVVIAALVASGGAAGAGSLTIAVEPTELVLVGPSTGTFRVKNPTSSSVSLTASTGDYVIRENGKVLIDPKLPSQRSAKAWLALSTKAFTLRPHATAELAVKSNPAKNAEAGDHHALVLFATKPSGAGRVLVRTRIAVAVLVRVAGPIKRKLAITGFSAQPKKHQVRLTIRNQGNINERLLRRAVTVALKRSGRTVQSLVAPPRDVLPFGKTVYVLHYRRTLKGRFAALVTVRPVNGAGAGALAPPRRPLKKTFRVRL